MTDLEPPDRLPIPIIGLVCMCVTAGLFWGAVADGFARWLLHLSENMGLLAAAPVFLGLPIFLFFRMRGRPLLPNPAVRRQPGQRLKTICFVAAAILAGLAYSYFGASTLTIENQSGGELTNVRVEVGRVPVWKGAIAAGGNEKIYADSIRGGSLEVWLDASGRSLHQTINGMAFGKAASYEMTVMPHLKIVIQKN